MTDQTYDVAIVGAGPNGLTAAAYLSRAGAKVIVLEGRFERGGTLATDDYSTPFQYNQAQLLLPLGEELPPYHDLELDQHAVAFIKPRIAFATKLENEKLAIERGGIGLGSELQTMLAQTSGMMTPLLYRPATEAALALGNGGVDLPLATLTPDDLAHAAVDERAAIILRYACALAGFPRADISLGEIGAFCLARLFEPALAVGGSKSLANGLFRAAARAGARCLVSTRVVALDPNDQGVEVRLADHRSLRARAVISTLDPITTFAELLGSARAGEVLSSVAEGWELDYSGPFTAHFGIKGHLPAPDCGGNDEPVIRVIGFHSEKEVASVLASVAAGRLPAQPAGPLTVTSRNDPLQASPGPFGPLHTLRYEAPAPYEYPQIPWGRSRVDYRRACWELIASNVEGLKATRLLFEFCDSPQDLERRFGTARRGSVRQGSLRREQTFTGRPHPSCADGRTPVPGLYLGGGSIHPGVPGSLGGGYNVAAVVCADLGLNRWWPPAPEGDGRSYPLTGSVAALGVGVSRGGHPRPEATLPGSRVCRSCPSATWHRVDEWLSQSRPPSGGCSGSGRSSSALRATGAEPSAPLFMADGADRGARQVCACLTRALATPGWGSGPRSDFAFETRSPQRLVEQLDATPRILR